jgi:membrane protein insertase Oxa1/YidC/SpoIIIJ
LRKIVWLFTFFQFSSAASIPRSIVPGRLQPLRPVLQPVLRPISNPSIFTRRLQSTNITPPTESQLVSDAAPIRDVIFEQLSSGGPPPVAEPYIGYLADYGINFGYGPTTVIKDGLEAIHVLLGGPPWWITLVASVFVFRALFFIPFMSTSSQAAKLGAMTAQSSDIKEQMNRARDRNDQIAVQMLSQKLKQEYKERGISFPRLILPPIVQGVVGFSVWRIGWALSDVPELGMAHGGPLWLSDMTVSDPFFVISALVFGIGYLNGRVSMLATKVLF